MRKNLQKNVILWLGIFLFLFLASCGSLRKEQVQREMGYVDKQARLDIKAGQFQKAIVIYREVYQKYPQDHAVRSGYIRTLESIKSNGDRAFERGDFALAGCAYEIVLKHVSSLTRLNGSLAFNRKGLTSKIKSCKKLLFENGLEQYRSGNLDQAISIWKSILAFDPENKEVRKVVDMATLQLKNLQKTKK